MTDYERTLLCLTCSPTGVLCDKSDVDTLQKYNGFFSILKEPQRRPDAYASIDKELLLLEHFQFDNTHITKKGSEQHKVTAKSNQTFEKKLLRNGDFAVLNERVRKSGEYYIDNFIAQFNSHYKKIDEYITEMKLELRSDFQSVYMGFVIEDSSPLGSIYLENYRPLALDLLRTTEFLTLFEESKKLDFVLFSMTGNVDNLYQSFISRNTIEQHKENAINAKEIDSFLFEQSFVASGRIDLK